MAKKSQTAPQEPQTPVEQTPVEQTPVEQTPVEQTPVEQTPVEQTPVEQTPVEQTPVEPGLGLEQLAADAAAAGLELLNEIAESVDWRAEVQPYFELHPEVGVFYVVDVNRVPFFTESDAVHYANQVGGTVVPVQR
jgi:hypothetical protein